MSSIQTLFGENINILDYKDIINDVLIKGKTKIIIPQSLQKRPLIKACLQYFAKFTKDITNLYQFEYDDKNGILESIPNIPFKNLELCYKNNTFWLSNIPISNRIITDHHGSADYVYFIILSFDCEKSIIDDIMKDAKTYLMSKILGIEHDQNKCYEVYSYSDGYWDILKGGHFRELSTIFQNKDKIDKLVTKINNFLNPDTKAIYKRLGIPYKLNILLYGPPGTGKTTFIEIATKLFNRKKLRYLHVTPKMDDMSLCNALSLLGEDDILACEDIDCLFVERKEKDLHKNTLTFSGLLNCFDGINRCEGLITFMTTNYKTNLDKALLRPGRIDIMEEFGYMSKNEIREMTEFYLLPDNINEFTNSFDIFYSHIKSYNITGAILSNYLLDVVLNKRNLLDTVDTLITFVNSDDADYTNKKNNNIYN